MSKYFNTADFSQPAPYTFGNVGRNLGNVYGPGEENLDFSVYKDISIKERLRLQIRAEAFNLLNHPNFGQPTGNISDPQFGVSTKLLGRSFDQNVSAGSFSSLYQIGSPRSIQVALKLTF